MFIEEIADPPAGILFSGPEHRLIHGGVFDVLIVVNRLAFLFTDCWLFSKLNVINGGLAGSLFIVFR